MFTFMLSAIARESGSVSKPAMLNTPVSELASAAPNAARSEEHTSELQSHHDLVCRLLLEKKNRCARDRRESLTGRLAVQEHRRGDGRRVLGGWRTSRRSGARVPIRAGSASRRCAAPLRPY